MMTPAILNPTSIQAGPVPPAKQNEGAASAPPFGEVLSRQIAGRGAADAGSKAGPKESGNAGAPAQPPAAPATAGSVAAAGSGKAADSDADEGDDSDAAASASAELLMLVANLAEANAIPAEPAAAIAADASAATATAAATGTAAAAAAGTAALPLTLRQADIAGNAPDRVAVPAAAAAALPDQAPAASLPATAALIEAAAADVKQPAGHSAARGPSAMESVPAPATGAPASPERRAATMKHAQPTLSGGVPAPSAQAAGTPPMQVEPMAAASPLAALRSAASEPEMQAGVTVAASLPMQQAAFNTVPAAAAPAADTLAPQVGATGWDQAVGQKVVWMAAGAQSSASLTLNPPDLGPLQVALSVVNNQATVTFTAAQPEVRQALEAALPKLREMLGDAGIQMGQASVNAGAPQQHGGHGNPHQASRGIDPSAVADTAVDAPLAGTRSLLTGGVRGLVDTFA